MLAAGRMSGTPTASGRRRQNPGRPPDTRHPVSAVLPGGDAALGSGHVGAGVPGPAQCGVDGGWIHAGLRGVEGAVLHRLMMAADVEPYRLGDTVSFPARYPQRRPRCWRRWCRWSGTLLCTPSLRGRGGASPCSQGRDGRVDLVGLSQPASFLDHFDAGFYDDLRCGNVQPTPVRLVHRKTRVLSFAHGEQEIGTALAIVGPSLIAASAGWPRHLRLDRRPVRLPDPVPDAADHRRAGGRAGDVRPIRHLHQREGLGALMREQSSPRVAIFALLMFLVANNAWSSTASWLNTRTSSHLKIFIYCYWLLRLTGSHKSWRYTLRMLSCSVRQGYANAGRC